MPRRAIPAGAMMSLPLPGGFPRQAPNANTLALADPRRAIPPAPTDHQIRVVQVTSMTRLPCRPPVAPSQKYRGRAAPVRRSLLLALAALSACTPAPTGREQGRGSCAPKRPPERRGAPPQCASSMVRLHLTGRRSRSALVIVPSTPGSGRGSSGRRVAASHYRRRTRRARRVEGPTPFAQIQGLT